MLSKTTLTSSTDNFNLRQHERLQLSASGVHTKQNTLTSQTLKSSSIKTGRT